MKEKLLVLDDEPRILASLENLLEDDYEVLTASDADTALELARRRDIAVVLSDERMPGLSRHEFLRRLKDVSNSTRVLLSGSGDQVALDEAISRGEIFAYVRKPWEPLHLKSTLASALQHFKLVQAVEHERALLRVLIENTPDLICFKSRDSRFTGVNREQARTFGVKNPEECVGKRDSDYIAAEAARQSYDDEQAIVRSGKPLIARVEKLRRPDGSVCWLSRSKFPIAGRSGSVTGIAVISRDITKLMDAEKSVREHIEHNRLIIETACDAFVSMEPDGSITAWNRHAELLFGWGASEIMGRRIGDAIVGSSHREALLNGLENFLTIASAGPRNTPIEIDALHRDGHEFPIEFTLWPVRLAGALSFHAFARDVSHKRRAIQQTNEETRHLQLLQAVTIAANESSSIESAARVSLDRICAYTGWPVGHVLFMAPGSETELVSAGIWRVEGRQSYSDFRQVIDRRRFPSGAGLAGRVLASGEPEWTTDIARDPNFSGGAAASQAGLRSGFGFPILVQNKVVGVLEFFSPRVTEPNKELLNLIGHIGAQLGQVFLRQQAEERQHRAVGLAESANRAKSEFLATMSHEIRTPMNAMLGMADLLSESDLDREQRDYVRIFQRGGAKLLDLVNEILDLSKVESGRVNLEAINFDLREVCNQAIEIMIVRAQAKGLSLTSEILPLVPTMLSGDPGRLRQILINLIGNALRFTERGGATLRVELNAAAAGAKLRFSVADTGIGISPDKVDVIFESFAQAESFTSRQYGGTGLGLAICKGLVELMGGEIGCTSEVGKGSTFFFSTPLQVAAPESAPASEAAGDPPAFVPRLVPTGQRAIRILIAEDSDDNLFLIEAYLKGSGFRIDVARDGKQAVEKVLSAGYDLVLMDVEMPLMDGHAATRAIRDWERQIQSPPVPIVALTAHALKDELRNSIEAGCTGCLSKPIKKATLLEAIYHYAPGTMQMTS